MNKLHMKGRILQLIHDRQHGGIWDWQISDAVMSEYGLSGAYWRGNTRVTLTDLFSSGIIESVEEELDHQAYFGAGRVLFKFKLNDFGRQGCATPHWPDSRCHLKFYQGDTMSDFWGYPGADMLAVAVIIVLSGLALYQARTFVTKI